MRHGSLESCTFTVDARCKMSHLFIVNELIDYDVGCKRFTLTKIIMVYGPNYAVVQIRQRSPKLHLFLVCVDAALYLRDIICQKRFTAVNTELASEICHVEGS